ncbi:hypothetical protein HGA88_05870 [Candidatus Roizmanbacteria bacterium]|nr:hypothetical protein [Candidatus Roizmanbacteria bacterium]
MSREHKSYLNPYIGETHKSALHWMNETPLTKLDAIPGNEAAAVLKSRSGQKLHIETSVRNPHGVFTRLFPKEQSSPSPTVLMEAQPAATPIEKPTIPESSGENMYDEFLKKVSHERIQATPLYHLYEAMMKPGYNPETGGNDYENPPVEQIGRVKAWFGQAKNIISNQLRRITAPLGFPAKR